MAKNKKVITITFTHPKTITQKISPEDLQAHFE